MTDVHAPTPGTAGEVYFVDAIGTIHVNWLSGSDLGVAYGEDELHKANEHETALYKIGKVANNQRQNPDGQHFCPRCGEEMDGIYRHAVSRNADVIICDACGQAEAIEDLIKAGYVKGKVLPIEEWACARGAYHSSKQPYHIYAEESAGDGTSQSPRQEQQVTVMISLILWRRVRS